LLRCGRGRGPFDRDFKRGGVGVGLVSLQKLEGRVVSKRGSSDFGSA